MFLSLLQMFDNIMMDPTWEFPHFAMPQTTSLRTGESPAGVSHTVSFTFTIYGQKQLLFKVDVFGFQTAGPTIRRHVVLSCWFDLTSVLSEFIYFECVVLFLSGFPLCF